MSEGSTLNNAKLLLGWLDMDSTRNASWVMEYLTKDSLRVEHETDRANSKFAVDKAVPEPFQVHPNRYLKSGYDKGHLAPAREFFSSH
jgi:endonuclease G